MKFETLNSGKFRFWKRLSIGISLFVLVLVGLLTFIGSYAKYKIAQSVPLATGTIDYSLADLNVVAIQVQKKDEDGAGLEEQYDKQTDVPGSGYSINAEKSYCEINGNKEDPAAKAVEIEGDGTGISFSNVTKQGTKCYVYFDVDESGSPDKTLAQLKQNSQGTVDKFIGTSCGGSCKVQNENGVYQAEDDYGTSYYYRGTVSNNWLKFGKATSGKETGDIWWRIIRINGNGSIRLIYAGTYSSGTTPNAKDAKNLIDPTNNAGNTSYPRAVKFNETYNDNKYVGYMYNNSPQVSAKFDDAHKVDSSSTKSTILTQVDLWWRQTNLGSLQDTYIDTDVGFCSDTQVNNTNETWWSSDTKYGYGTQQTAYAAYGRILLNGSWRSEQFPTLKCGIDPNKKTVDSTAQKRDLYTYTGAQPVKTASSTVEGNKALPVPVGLITADEVVYAGGFGGTANDGYWLNVGQYYWTMSPYHFNGGAVVFRVHNNGYLSNAGVNYNVPGVRPVINLKAGTKITLKDTGSEGTVTNPYVVET